MLIAPKIKASPTYKNADNLMNAMYIGNLKAFDAILAYGNLEKIKEYIVSNRLTSYKQVLDFVRKNADSLSSQGVEPDSNHWMKILKKAEGSLHIDQ